MSGCLTQADLLSFDIGSLPHEEAASVRAHLDTCESCRTAYDALRARQSAATIVSDNNGAAASDEQPTMILDANSARADSASSVRGSGTAPPAAAGMGSSPAAKMAKHFPKIEGYRILGILGQGGMGIVYHAVQTKLGRKVALKVLPAMMGTASPAAVTRFRREATAAARLHHTNIVPIYDFGESSDAWYYAMELISGQPLNVIIERLPTDSVARSSAAGLYSLLRTALTPSGHSDSEQVEAATKADQSNVSVSSSGRGRPYYLQVARWMADTADALEYAHSQGIIHRDIKPSNLILSTDGRIMLADFGLAKQAGEESMTMTGSLLGTLRYISPEQAMAKRMRVDHRTDIYSLGATMYELLAFQPTFTGDDDKELLGAIITREPTPLRKINSLIPPELDTICLKSLEKSPDARYPTARALAEDLRRYIHDLPIEAKRPGIIRRAVKFARRRRALVVGVAAAVLLSASIFYGINETKRRRDEEVKRYAAEVKQLCDSGLMYHANGEYPTATSEFEEALRLDPNHVDSLLALARTKKAYFNSLRGAGERGLLEQANELCRRARQLQPTNISAMNLHAVILKMLGRYDDAIAIFEELLAMDVGEDDGAQLHYAAAYHNLGNLNCLANDLENGESNLRKGAELMGLTHGEHSTAAWRNLAAEEHFQKHYVESLEHVQLAVETTPTDAASWVLKARIRLTIEGRKASEDALNWAKHADNLAGNKRGDAKRILAMAYLHNDQFERTIEEARHAIDLGDLLAINHLVIAIAEAKRGNLDAARAKLSDALKAWPERLSDEGDWFATAPAGQLWFESGAELHALKKEAEEAINSGALP